MSSYNSTSLSVNPLVGLIHNILHLNNKLHPVSNNFALSPSQLWNEYTLSVSVVPLIIGGLGILSILIFISIIIFRNWCHICKCSPGNRYNPDGTTDSKVWVSYELFHNSSLTSYYYISMIWIFVSIQGILVAYVFFILPYSNSAISSTSTLSNQFNVLSNIGITLQNENNTLAKSASYCTDHWTPSQAYSTFQSGLQGYSYFATEYISMIDPFNKKISQASSSMTLYGQTDFTIVIWTIYAACLLALILLQTGLYTSNRRVLLGAIGFSVFFMFCYVIVGAAMMFGLVSLSLHMYLIIHLFTIYIFIIFTMYCLLYIIYKLTTYFLFSYF